MESLKTTSGVRLSKIADRYHLSIRGSRESQTAFLVNGQALNPVMNSLFDLSLIDVGSIQKIEVFKNSNYLFIAENAIGGVVNIETNNKNPSVFSYSFGASSLKDFNWSLSSAVPIQNHLLSVALSGKEELGSYFYISPYDGVRKNVSHENHSESDHFSYQYKNDDLPLSFIQTSVYYSKSDKKEPGSDQYPTPNAESNNRLAGFNLFLQFLPSELRKTFSLNASYRLSRQESRYKNIDEERGYRSDYFHDYWQNAFSLDFRYASKRVVVNAHSFYANDQIKSNALDYGKKTSAIASNFFNHSIAFNVPYQFFNFLNSYAINTVDFKKAYFKTYVGMRFAYKEFFLSELNYQRQLRYPTFDELFTKESAFTVGNPKLQPETSHQMGIDVSYFAPYVNFSHSFYYRWIDNLIEWMRFGERYRPVNYTKVQTWGFDNAVKTNSLWGVTFSQSYDFIRSFISEKASSDYGFQIPFAPKHTLVSAVEYNAPFGFWIGANYRFISTTYLSSREVRYRNPLNLLDFNLGYRFRSWLQFQMNFLNVLNKTYEDAEGYLNSGFEFRFQIRGYV